MKTIAALLLEDNGYLAQSERVSLYAVDFVNFKPSEFKNFSEKLRKNLKIQALSLSGCNLYACQPVVIESLFALINGLDTLENLCLARVFNHDFPVQDILTNFERMSAILRLPVLKEIDLSSNFLFRCNQKASVVLAMKNFFMKHPMLRIIDLRGNAIGVLAENEFESFCDVLRVSQLETIVLAANELARLSELSFERLLSTLSQISCLRKLDLSGNDLSGKRLEIVTNFLQQSNVETLLLSHCAIGSMQANSGDLQKLLQVLSDRNLVRILDIGNNGLELLEEQHCASFKPITVIMALSRCIHHWDTLCRLVISNNDLSRHNNILLFLAKMILIRSPGLGVQPKFALSQIEKDFANTGYQFEMQTVIKEVQEHVERERESALLKNAADRLLWMSGETGLTSPEPNTQEPGASDVAKKPYKP